MNCQRLVPLTGTRIFFSGPAAMMSSSPMCSLRCSAILRRTRSRWCSASRRPASRGRPDSPTTVIALASPVEQMPDVLEQVPRRVLGVAALLDQRAHHLVEALGLLLVGVGLRERDLDDVLELIEQVLLDPGGEHRVGLVRQRPLPLAQ